jgi:arsenite methyltransferase
MRAGAKPGPPAGDLSPSAIKQCCAAIYDSEAAKLLLGDSFHPGGSKLTQRLGEILGLTPRTRVLDVAAGNGTSAIFLARKFGCEAVGVDYGRNNVQQAARAASAAGLSERVRFHCADAEQLPFPDASFDAIICECALCTFPNKQAAAGEFARVLRSGGRVGLSDLTREGALAPELDSLLSWVACIADAQPLSAYAALLSAAKLTVLASEQHNDALADFVSLMRTRLLVPEVMVGLQMLVLPGFDFAAAKSVAKSALAAIREGRLGYAIVAAAKTA